MKKGQATGKTDAAYTQIKVGDQLKNKHSGMLGTVNKYGHIQLPGGNINKNWKGDDWLVIKPYDPADDIKREKPMEIKEHEPIDIEPEIPKDFDPKDPSPIQTVTETETKQPEQEAAEISLEGIEDQALADELRARGYEVTAKKLVPITTYETIEL